MATLIWLLVPVAVAAALLYALKRYQVSQVFRPDRTDALAAEPISIGLEFVDVFFHGTHGKPLHGWWVPHAEASYTLLMCHGNAGNISGRVESVGFYQRLGLNVFIFDYRGYGRSPGTPSEHGLYADARTAWQYLTDTRGIPEDRIILLGRSLGGAVATHLALRTEPAAVIIESTFLSIPHMARERFRHLPLWRLPWIRFDNSARIGKIKRPLLMVHSVEDEVVPYSHGAALHKLTAGRQPLLSIHGSHSGGYAASGQKYAVPLTQFLHDTGIDLPGHSSAAGRQRSR